MEGGKRKRGVSKAVCPYVGAQGLQTLRDAVLGAVRDIEQLLSLARETRSCPYYATRLAIPPAQVHTITHLFPQMIMVLRCENLVFDICVCIAGGAALSDSTS